MKKHNFKLGDRVVLVGHHNFELHSDEPICRKGKVVYGTIQEVTLDNRFPIRVKWDNTHRNSYNPLELRLVNKWFNITL